MVDTKRAARILVRLPRLRGVRAAELRRTAQTALAQAAPGVIGDVGIALVDDRQMQALNLRYRGKDSPTDVLAFPLSDGQDTLQPFGDVIISYETARRQAHSYGAPLRREVQRLLIHGVLHLCGYDHHERRAAARMYGLTRRLLQAVNKHG